MGSSNAETDNKEIKQFQAVLHGRVQGVNFRYYTRQRARELDLRGYVRNRPDGTVAVVAQGGEQSLRTLLAWLRQGPRLADVRNVDLEWQSLSQEYGDFEVRY